MMGNQLGQQLGITVTLGTVTLGNELGNLLGQRIGIEIEVTRSRCNSTIGQLVNCNGNGKFGQLLGNSNIGHGNGKVGHH